MQNAPITCLTKKVTHFLRSIIGMVEEIGVGDSGDCLGSFMRVRFRFDITKRLLRSITVLMDKEDKEITVLL